jgi:O-antigen/teichoic acid export membrane protein
MTRRFHLPRSELAAGLPPPERPRLARGAKDALREGGTHWMMVGVLVGGVGAYLFQVLGTRTLGEQAFAPIGAIWTIQYLVFSVFLHSVEVYVTREVAMGRSERLHVGTRLWPAIIGVAVALSAATWLVRDRLLYGLDDLAAVLGLIVLSFGAFVLVRGQLAGLGRFKAYGLVSASESSVRLLFASAVALSAPSTRAFAWSLPIGGFVAAAWWPLLRRRRRELVPVERPNLAAPRTSRFLLLTTGTNAIAQFLLAGGPLVIVFLAAPAAEVSVFFITMTAARVPIVLALGGLLSRVLASFTRLAEGGQVAALARSARRVALATLAAAAFGSVTGGVIGGPLVGALFGRGFTPPWWLAAAAGGGMVLASGALLLNQLLIARSLEHWLPPPWIAGLAMFALVVAATPGSPSARVAAAFVAAQVVTLAGLSFASQRPQRRADAH